jgi:hypothetical protein
VVDLEQRTIADHWALLELDCSSADKAVLSAGGELDQVVTEVAVVDLVAGVLGLAAPVLVADRIVLVAAVTVHRTYYRAVEAAEGKERRMVLCSEGRKVSQQRQHLV